MTTVSNTHSLNNAIPFGTPKLWLKTTAAKLWLLFSLFLAHALSAGSVYAFDGDIEWNGWTLSYTTETLTGLELHDVSFNGRKILNRANFPVMRVEYDNDVCGPFVDILLEQNYVPIAVDPPNDTCNGDGLCARSYDQGDNRFLELGVNAKLGEYEIYQSFVFSADGYFDSYVFSRGLQCDANHRHHAHWMFDFDIDGKEDDQVLKNSGDLQSSEFNDRRENTSYWTIQDAETGLRVEVIPGENDGFPDQFAQWDAAARRYNSGETGLWRWGARGDIGSLFNDAENIDRQDIVFWYISHLDHKAVEGSQLWHASGPRVRVIEPQ